MLDIWPHPSADPDPLKDNACNYCRDPGACCRNFFLNMPVAVDATVAEVQTQVDGHKLPFTPIEPFVSHFASDHRVLKGVPYVRINHDKPFTFWRFNCTKLGPDGRCTIYDTRPHLCHTYVPREDAMCIERHPDFKAEDAAEQVREYRLNWIKNTQPADNVPRGTLEKTEVRA